MKKAILSWTSRGSPIVGWETNGFLKGCAAHRYGLPVAGGPAAYERAFAAQLAIVTGKRPTWLNRLG
jgi:hypothetical protein